MTDWKIFHVIFRLTAPMHIGCGKSGNLQRTYPFVTGRVFWGALTARITRNIPEALKLHRQQAYQLVGNQVHQDLAYTYFYPAVKSSAGYEVRWPWSHDFAARHIRTYASTALSYPEQHAREATLHETEYLSPFTCDTGEPVYLRGYVFEKESTTLQWQKALEALQFGGERCYGWGDVKLFTCDDQTTTPDLFDGYARFIDQEAPVIELPSLEPDITLRGPGEGHILAHAEATHVHAHGKTEPLVGREWKTTGNHPHQHKAGQQKVSGKTVCFIPGSTVRTLPYRFTIRHHGVWDVITKTES